MPSVAKSARRKNRASVRGPRLTYSLAINEALHQMMDSDPRVVLWGQGVKSPWYVGNTTRNLLERFGSLRVFDTPVSENGVTGAAVGAAISGLRPVVVHPRTDFMLYAFDPILNQAANWHYMFGGRMSVPLVVWTIVNRGGEQGAQHSQALHSVFSHFPGLKVVCPSTPYDAKGLMVAAIQDDNPVIFIDDRWLYGVEGDVPHDVYAVPIGRGIVRRAGHHLTLVASSFLSTEALRAAEDAARQGINTEVIDLLTLKPLDVDLILSSVRRTGRLLVVDAGWRTCGYSAQVASEVAEKGFQYLKSPIRRLTLPDVPAPVSSSLERSYYFGSREILENIQGLMK